MTEISWASNQILPNCIKGVKILPRLCGREVEDADAIASSLEEGEGPSEAVPDGSQPAEPLAALHQVAHIAISCVAHAVTGASVPAVHPHDVQQASEIAMS